MSTAWPDHDYAFEDESAWESDFEEIDDLERDTSPTDDSSRCEALFAWHGGRPRPDYWVAWQRAAEGLTSPPVMSLRLGVNLLRCEPINRYWPRVEGVMHALRETIEELDVEAVPPPENRPQVAAQLESFAERLIALRNRLPMAEEEESADYDGEEDGRLVVDWRLLNRAQLEGWPAGIRDEGGTLLMDFRPSTFGVAIREPEDEEPSIE